jgi:hypothetical protein
MANNSAKSEVSMSNDTIRITILQRGQTPHTLHSPYRALQATPKQGVLWDEKFGRVDLLLKLLQSLLHLL